MKDREGEKLDPEQFLGVRGGCGRFYMGWRQEKAILEAHTPTGRLWRGSAGRNKKISDIGMQVISTLAAVLGPPQK